MAATETLKIDSTEETAEEEAESTLKYEIINYPADSTLETYRQMWDSEEIEIPNFQRDYVWDQVRASRLIESFLLGLPVPSVFMYKERNSSRHLVIDGQQRITSIVSYLRGIFKEKKFRLKKVEPQWRDKSFDELEEEDQFRLRTSVMRSVVIQQLDPSDNTSIYHIYERLNTGGVNLTPMEIRQCISSPDLIASLGKMNEDVHWRKILGTSRPDPRLRDMELILRCHALFNRSDRYEKPMKGFLNSYAEYERKNPSNYSEMETSFSRICENIHDQLGDRSFQRSGKLNYGITDSIVSSLLDIGPINNLKQKFDILMKNESYLEAITRNTSDIKEVKNRLRIAHEILSS